GLAAPVAVAPAVPRLYARRGLRQGGGKPAHRLAGLHHVRGDIDVSAERGIGIPEGRRRVVDGPPGLADLDATGLLADEHRDRLGGALARPRRRRGDIALL